MKALFEKIRDLIFKPKQTWEAIDQDPVTTKQLVYAYLLPLAAIPAIAFFLGYSILGIRIPFSGVYRMVWWQALITALTGYGVAILSTVALAHGISRMAAWFNSTPDLNSGYKLIIFCYAPFWVAGVLYIIPNLSVIVMIAGLYGLYLLFLGIPRIMHPPENRATVYGITAIVVTIVIHVLLSQITRFVLQFFGPDLPKIT